MPLPESNPPVYPGSIYALTRSDRIDAGDNGDGISNRQPTELAERTNWLKKTVDELVTTVGALTESVTMLTQRLQDVESQVGNRGFAVIAHRVGRGGVGGGLPEEKQWGAVPLNSEIIDEGDNVSFNGTSIRVKAGTYRVRGKVIMCGIVRGQSRLYDVTNSSTLLIGMSIGSTVDVFANDDVYGGLTLSQQSNVDGTITLQSDTDIELQAIFAKNHQFNASLGVNVYGIAISQIPALRGETEQYSSLVLERVR